MEETLERSSGHEVTTSIPTDSQYDQKDKQDGERADDQIEETTTEQSPQEQFSQAQHKTFATVSEDISHDPQTSQQVVQRTYEHMDSEASRQPQYEKSEEPKHQMSALLDERSAQHRLSEKEERSKSKHSDSPLSSQMFHEFSRHRKSNQDDQRIAEQKRLSDLIQPTPHVQIDSELSGQTGSRMSQHNKYPQETELTTKQDNPPDISELKDAKSIINELKTYSEQLKSNYKELNGLQENQSQDHLTKLSKLDLSHIKEGISKSSVSTVSDTESKIELPIQGSDDPYIARISQGNNEFVLPSTSAEFNFLSKGEKSQLKSLSVG